MDEVQFHDFIARVRHGDADAAAAIVRHYEPQLRRLVRLRLTDPHLRRLYDSGDICQSVMANFFVRASLGQYQFDEPGKLLSLLATMARNRLLNLARDRKAEKNARAGGDHELLHTAADDAPNPTHVLACKELLQKARDLLSPDEARLAELRQADRTWNEIADELNDSPEKLRKKYSRALDRVARQLGLLESSHDRPPET